jgi:hypothetical protein
MGIQGWGRAGSAGHALEQRRPLPRRSLEDVVGLFDDLIRSDHVDESQEASI